ncbi:MAG: hypothetical protein ACEPOV_13595 [Hyphomicrobiales bacterium]
MKKNLLLFIIFLLCLDNTTKAQISFSEIKNSSEYIWGEGKGKTIEKADNEALGQLSSQISIQVEKKFSLIKNELRKNGKEGEFKQVFESVINTYSNTRMTNVERIIISDEPEAIIFRYIKKSDVEKIFSNRKEKVYGFIRNAKHALHKYQISDALRYYYWALCLLKSIPDGDVLSIDINNDNVKLLSFIPYKMNEIFSGLDFSISELNKTESDLEATLNITYNGTPVENLEYCFWEGDDYSNKISARAGIGYIELDGLFIDTKFFKVKIEYLFANQTKIDNELKSVIDILDVVPFKNSIIKFPAKKATEKELINSHKVAKIESVSSIKSVSYPDIEYKRPIDDIITSIKANKFERIRHNFSDNGWDVFNKLIRYGNAKITGKYKLSYIKTEDGIACRGLPIRFSFKNNHKQFIEHVVFHVNKKNKVHNVTFALSDNALNDILNKESWKEQDRLLLINFLENYKTAYALKRIDYLDTIFSDNALIITGTIVKLKSSKENAYKNNSIIRYNKQTKDQYINNLRHSFLSKEYINIKFEDNHIRKAGNGQNIYGVQIKQHYYSSNYGDTGYLFLIVDLNNSEKPIIHVRTWQPKIFDDNKLIDLSDFS